MSGFNYKIEGMEALQAKMKMTQFKGGIMDFWKRATLTVLKFARLRSPFRTGRLQDSIVSRIDPSNIPMWGEVGTGVTHKGVSYPTVLEMSERTHYRATSRMGQPTKGWLSGALPESAEGINQAIEKLAKDMEQQWQH